MENTTEKQEVAVSQSDLVLEINLPGGINLTEQLSRKLGQPELDSVKRDIQERWEQIHKVTQAMPPERQTEVIRTLMERQIPLIFREITDMDHQAVQASTGPYKDHL